MSAAGESSSEAAPVRYREDCQKTAEIIQDKVAAAGGPLVRALPPPEQLGNLGRDIRLEYDTGVALVCTSGKRPTCGIDLATRHLPEALTARQGVTGGIVLYDYMFRFQKMSDERRAHPADPDGEDARRSWSQRNSYFRTSKKHQEAQSSRCGDAKARESRRHRDPARTEQPAWQGVEH